MIHDTSGRTSMLMTIGLITICCTGLGATDGPWEELAGGITGRIASFEGVDGALIAGYVRKPAGEGPFPLVIILHGGGPTARPVNSESGDERARLQLEESIRASNVLGRANKPPIPAFLAEGWAVYSIDYRTNPRYTLDPLEWDDTLIAVNRARTFSFVNPEKIAMFGGSHGAHVTARMASRVSLCCAVLCAPAGLDLIALSHLAEQGAPIGGNQRLIREMEQRSGVKMSDIERNPGRYDYTSPLTEVAQVRCPILMISGRNDTSGPFPVMDRYVQELRAAGKAAESYHPENGPHGFYVASPKEIPETAESTRRAVAFIESHFETPNPTHGPANQP